MASHCDHWPRPGGVLRVLCRRGGKTASKAAPTTVDSSVPVRTRVVRAYSPAGTGPWRSQPGLFTRTDNAADASAPQ